MKEPMADGCNVMNFFQSNRKRDFSRDKLVLAFHGFVASQTA
jgi:hypothetical protein